MSYRVDTVVTHGFGGNENVRFKDGVLRVGGPGLQLWLCPSHTPQTGLAAS